MASIFGHVAASAALGSAFFPKQVRPVTLLLTGFCAFAPDLDVLAFRFGVSYSSEWGHRGWTHSLCFAMIFGSLMAGLFAWFNRRSASGFRYHPWLICAWCILSTASHPLLDMLTNGGRGVALWWPMSAERLFFPFHPILVSPLGAAAFFSEWGLRVLWSELIWIGLPSLLLVIFAQQIRGYSV